MDNPRIEELRRRVQKDSASIAFAQLAEEYRRAGSYKEAIAACRVGLVIHPGYLSARVTLGRALIEINDLEAAESELTFVQRNAPENLAAIRGLAEIHHRRGHLADALTFYQAALGLAKHDPDLEQAVEEISRALAPESPPVGDGLSFEQSTAVLSMVDESSRAMAPALPELERFLDTIHTYRRRSLGLGRRSFEEATPVFSVVDGFPRATGLSAAAVHPGVHGTGVERTIGRQDAMRAAERREPAMPEPPALPELERFLDAIHTYRQRRAV